MPYRLVVPDTPAARGAHAVAGEYLTPSLLNHSLRSYVWAVEHARRAGLRYDDELLFVAAMLHDIGLTDAFDNHARPFEHAGGDVARVLTAGAQWTELRRGRVAQVIVSHMWDEVSAQDDPEGHLLAFSTAMDISGRNRGTVPEEVCADVVRELPRLELAVEFADAMTAQGARKPGCAAAQFVMHGGPDRLASNPLARLSDRPVG